MKISKARAEARIALKQYPKLKRRQAETDMQITPVYGGAAVQHSASRTTENVALRSNLTEREENIISAVEFAMRMQHYYPNGDERLKMMELVYFKKTHTLAGAAEVCHYSVDAVFRWNIELLTAVYVGLKK